MREAKFRRDVELTNVSLRIPDGTFGGAATASRFVRVAWPSIDARPRFDVTGFRHIPFDVILERSAFVLTEVPGLHVLRQIASGCVLKSVR